MLQDMDKPSKVEVGQRWRWTSKDGDTACYRVLRREGPLWRLSWENTGESICLYTEEETLIDEFLGYADGYTAPAPESSGNRAADWLRNVAKVLEEKAISYGDSVGNPIRVFSHAGKTEGIKVRIDDKLSRVARGKEWPGDDVIVDLVGYLALLAVTTEDK